MLNQLKTDQINFNLEQKIYFQNQEALNHNLAIIQQHLLANEQIAQILNDTTTFNNYQYDHYQFLYRLSQTQYFKDNNIYFQAIKDTDTIEAFWSNLTLVITLIKYIEAQPIQEPKFQAQLLHILAANFDVTSSYYDSDFCFNLINNVQNYDFYLDNHLHQIMSILISYNSNFKNYISQIVTTKSTYCECIIHSIINSNDDSLIDHIFKNQQTYDQKVITSIYYYFKNYKFLLSTNYKPNTTKLIKAAVNNVLDKPTTYTDLFSNSEFTINLPITISLADFELYDSILKDHDSLFKYATSSTTRKLVQMYGYQNIKKFLTLKPNPDISMTYQQFLEQFYDKAENNLLPKEDVYAAMIFTNITTEIFKSLTFDNLDFKTSNIFNYAYQNLENLLFNNMHISISKTNQLINSKCPFSFFKENKDLVTSHGFVITGLYEDNQKKAIFKCTDQVFISYLSLLVNSQIQGLENHPNFNQKEIIIRQYTDLVNRFCYENEIHIDLANFNFFDFQSNFIATSIQHESCGKNCTCKTG